VGCITGLASGGFSPAPEPAGRRERQERGQRGESVWKGSTHFCGVTHQPLGRKKIIKKKFQPNSFGEVNKVMQRGEILFT